ncbi:MAG: APC family permease [Thaumarchaeota archaeon]|nr:APC family permease [Nitrososphaerota archaeon]
MKRPGVFLRDSTGLVKNVTLLDAISLNLSSMSVGTTLAIIGFTTILLPSVSGLNLVYASIIGFALSIPQVIVYTMMSERISRTGGDYVWVSRTFGGLFGGPISFMGFALEAIAYIALVTLSTVSAIGSVGLNMGYSNLLNLAIPGADPAGQFIIGAGIFTAIILLNIARPRAGFKFLTVLMAVGIFTILLAFAVLLVAGRTGVENYVNSLGGGISYDAIASSYSGGTFNLANTMLIVPLFAFFVYPWFIAAPAVGSEIKSRRSTKWNITLSALIALILMTGSFGILYYVGGFDFINGALANPNLVNNYSFNFWTLAMGVSGNAALAWLLGIGWIVWDIAAIGYGIVVISRYFLAQAFDRFLPSQMAYVSPRTGSPVVAHSVDLIVSIALIGAASFLYGSFVSLYGAALANWIYFIAVGAAATVYASRHEKGGAKAVLAISGVLMSVVFVYLLYEFLVLPSIYGGNLLAYGYVAVSYILGLGIYLASRQYYGKRGIDISLAFKEIPPE